MSTGEEGTTLERLEVDGTRLYSLHQINQLPEPVKERIYFDLLPPNLLADYGIDPQTLCDAEGHRLVTFTCPVGSSLVQIDVRPEPDFRDPLLYLELTDTRLNQIEVMLFLVNDPNSERFDTDLDWQGRRTKFGTLRRNIPEEIRAMEAGLVPGQVRRGLRLTRPQIPLLERFFLRLGHDYYLMEPLGYHNAVILERLGCNYVQGLRKMQRIHQEFQPGGYLYRKLDGSTPFRQPDAWRSIRGRSWAIHDGILGEPWHGVRMYKRVGIHAGVDTFPGGLYWAKQG
jgi:hypothetical protein